MHSHPGNPRRLATRVASLLVVPFLLLVSALLSLDAHASGRVREIRVGALHVQRVFIPANVAERITVDSLGPSTADSVIHVQTDHTTTGGDFIAGNDDCAPPALWSCVDIPVSSAGRWVTVIVRPFGSFSAGNGTLRSAAGLFPITQIGFSGDVINIGSMPVNSHVMTVRQNRGDIDPNSNPGSNDTRLLVISSDNVSKALAFDDDDGVGKMSWVHLGVPCTGGVGCQVMVGAGDGFVGMTTLDWDSDAHGADSDADGFSNEYEQTSQSSSDVAMRSDPLKKDTDGDGIPDGAELMGVDVTPSVLEFPYYGAKPNQKDLFLELDWQPGFQASTFEGINIQGPFVFSPGAPNGANDIAIHADIGQDGPVANRYGVGNYGGATPIAVGSDACAGFTTQRIGYFRHGVLYGSPGTASGDCFFSGNTGQSIAHETGHTLGLAHGGRPDYQMNGNMLYPSTMNYAFESWRPFSTNALGGIVVNPSSVNEATWAGSSSADISYIGAYMNVSGRSVDWNQDNIFTAAPVKGVANIARESMRIFSSTVANTSDEVSPALTWLPGTGFFYFTQRKSDNTTRYRFSTNIQSECTKFRVSHWEPCGSFSSAFTVGGPKNSSYPAVTWFQKNGSTKAIALAYKSDARKLVVQTGTFTNASTGLTWTQIPVPGSPSMLGWPSVVRNPSNPAELFIFAAQDDGTGIALKVWKLAGGAITGPNTTVFEGGGGTAYIGPGGVSTTLGFLKGDAAPSIFAAIGLPETGATSDRIAFARFAPTSATWVRFPDLDAGFQGPFTTREPIGFAYAPFPGSFTNDGRFWLSWTPILSTTPVITKTVGNNPAAQTDPVTGLKPRSLTWNRPMTSLLEWDHIDNGMALAFELGQDSNLRGAYVTDSGKHPVILPIADGAANTNFNDHDDWRYLRGNLACSLRNSNMACLP